MSTPSVTEQQREWVARARAHVDPEELAQLCLDMTAIPSPTGEELELATYLVRRFEDEGLAGELQQIDGRQANAVGWLRGRGEGPTLMLYAPLDTAFTGGPEDAPWLGDSPRPDFLLPPRREGAKIVGLGAENPKAFAACAVAAAVAVAREEIPLRGELVVGLAGGSMPVTARPGFGSGVTHMLRTMAKPDFCVILKPGYAVAHEEVGLALFRLLVRGAVGYTGIRHKGPYRNPIVDAARIVTALEEWFPEYTGTTASGLVVPQGAVNAIRGGEPGAFNPGWCELSLDLRVSPRMSVDEVASRLEEALDGIRAEHPELDVSTELMASLPGSHTPPDSWIVHSLVRAWEDREGREHAPPGGGSGASDVGIIRENGIAAARIGLPMPETPSPYLGFSMGVADVDSMTRLTEVLVDVIVDTTTRTREEVGLVEL